MAAPDDEAVPRDNAGNGLAERWRDGHPVSSKPGIEAILGWLKGFKERYDPSYTGYPGLCGMARLPSRYGMFVGHHLEDYRWLRRTFQKWPLFSGDLDYPVPHPDADPGVAYYNDKENRWNRDHPYGQARWSLLEFIIQEGEKYLEEEKLRCKSSM